MFRSTDFNPLSINGLFLLNKTKYFCLFFHVTWTHISCLAFNQSKRLNCWYLFYSLKRQTERRTGRQTGKQAGRQQSSVLYNLMQMEVFFSSKKRISLVSTAIAKNRLTLLSHLTWLPWFRMNYFTCWKWFVCVYSSRHCLFGLNWWYISSHGL